LRIFWNSYRQYTQKCSNCHFIITFWNLDTMWPFKISIW
jgi:hypothetical protein